MRIRPCIDIHNGKVKQIVGGTLRDADGGLTCVRVIITKDTAGRVDAAWQHEDPTCGKMPIAKYDVGYQETIGFWESVKDHIRMLESGDIPGECLGLGYGWQEC